MHTVTVVDGVCDSQHMTWSSWCVRIYTTYMTSTGAETQCNNGGGYLLELSDESQQLADLKRLLSAKGISEVWLGGRKQKSWYWSKDGAMDSKIL